MSKRKVGRFTLATVFTGLMGAAVYNGYKKLGATPEPVTMTNVKQGIVAASLLSGIVWTIAAL